MKKYLLLFLLLNFLFLIPTSHAQPGEWVWVHGNNVVNSPGSFGTQGVPSPTNKPPSFYEACEWTDLAGNFWLFGGLNTFSDYGDLWKYDPVANEWTWVKGTGVAGNPGTSECRERCTTWAGWAAGSGLTLRQFSVGTAARRGSLSVISIADCEGRILFI